MKIDFKFWLNIITILALAALVVISRDQFVEAFRKLGDVNTVALLFMIPLQLANYYAVARLYHDYFASLGEKLRMRTMYAIALELNFVNHVFPSGGVSGFSYLSLRLKQEHIPTAKSTLAQILRFVLTFVSFLLLLFFGMLILSMKRSTSPLTILVASTIAFGTLFGVLVSVYIISSASRIRAFVGFLPRAVNRVAKLLHRRDRNLIDIEKVENTLTDLHQNYVELSKDWSKLKKPFLWSIVMNISEVATIYMVYIAFGELINPGALILAYAVANFAGLVAVLPGGVGVYEGLMTAVLASAGVDKALALSATVMYRIITMVLFLPIGYYFYHKVLRRGGNISKSGLHARATNPDAD